MTDKKKAIEKPTEAGGNEETNAKLSALEIAVVEKDDRISELEITVAKLSKGMEKAVKGPVDMPKPVKIGKDLYRFAIPAVKYKGKRITAQDVADDKELAAELIAQGSGMLVKV